ncbi:5'-nucleotidase C-terminal domain-containing protein [Sphingobacterium spiritivorum]|uniref:5'-nucleotidase C-terminal domain-containing protein n=1 Tax=Sphingobacterium spiritivorum TaxID=258 RepID=UPI003DA30207
MYRFNIRSLALVIGLGFMGFTSCKTLYTRASDSYQGYEMNNTIAADSAVIALYAPYKQQMESEMNRVIGYSNTYLTKTRDAESLIGNFFADALLDIGKTLDKDAVFSFATKGGIRTDMRQGDITVGKIFEIMPFENKISILELSGKDVLTLADFIAQTGGQPIGGMRMEIVGKKATSVKINGQDIDPAKHYKMVTYDYIANGGDNLDALASPVSRKDYESKVREGLMDYIGRQTKAGKHINAVLDGRVKISQ